PHPPDPPPFPDTTLFRSQWLPGSTTIQWNPIDAASLGTDFRTHSLFINDTWRINGRLSVNAGLRWDRNAGRDSADNPVADDSGLDRKSTRLNSSHVKISY